MDLSRWIPAETADALLKWGGYAGITLLAVVAFVALAIVIGGNKYDNDAGLQ